MPIQLKCYEPPGLVLALSDDDLSRHVIALGATGTGKTSALVNPVLRQLLSHRIGGRKLGILVMDPKADDTEQRVKHYAREAGRERDVVILSPTGSSYYPFFAGLQKLRDIDGIARRVLGSSADMGPWNTYWTEGRVGLIQTALTLLVASGKPAGFDEAAEFLRSFVYDVASPAVKGRVDFVERLLKDSRLRPATRRRLQMALVETQNWWQLDARTREIHKSAIGNALRPLLCASSREYFDEARGFGFRAGDVLHGKVLVCSVNAIRHPELARLLFKTLKNDFYDAVLSRPALVPGTHNHCALILDELPLAVGPEDLEALATIRSHGGIFLAAAQGLHGLDAVLGRRGRESLLNNFGSCFFFASRENELDVFALLSLGLKGLEKDHSPGGPTPIPVLDWSQPPQPPQPVCPPGTLARLAQHHCLAKLAGGAVTESPVWLEPIFHSFPQQPCQPEPDDLGEAVVRLKATVAEEKTMHASPALLIAHMHERGHKLLTPPSLVSATWSLCVPHCTRAEMLREAERYEIEGLGQLPSCWLLGLLRWLERNCELAPTVAAVAPRDGILWLQLRPPSTWAGMGPLTQPAMVNLQIYPSLWRPLSQRHWVRLFCERPDLREELLALPQVGLRRTKPAAGMKSHGQ